MFGALSMPRIAQVLLCSLALACTGALAGCEASGEPVRLARLALEQATSEAAQPALRVEAVRPTRPPVDVHLIAIEDERYLGDVARQLGATVDSVMADNQLQDTALKPGMQLRVQTTADLVVQFEAAREARKARRAEREAAKQAALEEKARLAAEERRRKSLEAKAKKLGVSVDKLMQGGELKTDNASSRHVKLPAHIDVP